MIVLIAIVGTIIFLYLYTVLHRAFGKKCPGCDQEAMDTLRYPNGKEKDLCRKHLISEFKQVFLGFNKKMIVLYPDWNIRNPKGFYYQYYTPEDIKKYQLADIAGDVIDRGLNTIQGSCQKCSSLASIAYWDKGSYQWGKEAPKFTEITKPAELLCAECCWPHIESPIRNFPASFSEPLIAPHKVEGIMMPWKDMD